MPHGDGVPAGRLRTRRAALVELGIEILHVPDRVRANAKPSRRTFTERYTSAPVAMRRNAGVLPPVSMRCMSGRKIGNLYRIMSFAANRIGINGPDAKTTGSKSAGTYASVRQADGHNMMYQLLALLALATVSATPPPPAPSATLTRAAASLDNSSHCVPFQWIANDKGSARGAITVPVAVNGRPLRMQLDTGADATSVYGQVAAQSGWSKTGSEMFRAARFTIADTSLDRPTIYVNTDMEADADVQGTLGLPALVGRIAVLDYPGKRLCLFAEADVPTAIAEAPSVRAMLRNAKLYVPVSIGAFTSDAFVFDTGSSELPLNVDLATWRTLTGRATTDGAPASYKGSAWGKPLVIPGAPSSDPVSIGKTALGRVTVFTNPAQPTGFTDWPVPTVGILGNAPVWDGMVVLDLTARLRFAIIR